MPRSRWLALVLASSLLANVLMPCPEETAVAAREKAGRLSRAGPFAAPSHALHDGHGDHAADPDGGDPPCHAVLHVLTAPCPCGCGGGVPGVEPLRSALTEMLLAAVPRLAEAAALPGRPSRPGVPPCAPFRAIDHVPIAHA